MLTVSTQCCSVLCFFSIPCVKISLNYFSVMSMCCFIYSFQVSIKIIFNYCLLLFRWCMTVYESYVKDLPISLSNHILSFTALKSITMCFTLLMTKKLVPSVLFCYFSTRTRNHKNVTFRKLIFYFCSNDFVK